MVPFIHFWIEFALCPFCQIFWFGNQMLFQWFVLPKEFLFSDLNWWFDAWMTKRDKLHEESHEIFGDIIKNHKNGFPDWLWSHGKWKTNERPHEILKLIPRKLGLPPKDCLPRKLKIWLRLPNWLGDIIMAIPVIRLIHEERPDCELTVFVRDPYVIGLKALKLLRWLLSYLLIRPDTFGTCCTSELA